MRKRRSFTDDFKNEIVEILLSGNMSAAHLLNSSGKPYKLVLNWINMYPIDGVHTNKKLFR